MKGVYCIGLYSTEMYQCSGLMESTGLHSKQDIDLSCLNKTDNNVQYSVQVLGAGSHFCPAEEKPSDSFKERKTHKPESET